MNKPHAVRFLLLKHLWLLRDGVPPARHREIARSLQVEIESDHYAVRWTDGGRPCRRTIPLDDLSFYRRGDVVVEAQKRAELDRPNDEVAAAFARHSLGLLDERSSRPGTRAPSWDSPSSLGYVLLLIGAAVVDPTGWLVYALLTAVLLGEFHPLPGAFVWPIFTLGAMYLGLPTTAVLSGVSLAVLHFLDPHRRYRFAVIAALLAMAGFASLAHQAGDDHRTILLLLVVTPVVLVVVLGRALFGVHLRFFPLAFPVICLGLIGDGHRVGGIVGLGGAALALVARIAVSGHLVHPLAWLSLAARRGFIRVAASITGTLRRPSPKKPRSRLV